MSQGVNTVSVLIELNTRYLLCHNIKRGKYESVGGKIENGEHHRAAAIRELNEETGLHVDDIKLFFYVGYTRYHDRTHFTYAIRLMSTSGPIRFNHEFDPSRVILCGINDLYGLPYYVVRDIHMFNRYRQMNNVYGPDPRIRTVTGMLVRRTGFENRIIIEDIDQTHSTRQLMLKNPRLTAVHRQFINLSSRGEEILLSRAQPIVIREFELMVGNKNTVFTPSYGFRGLTDWRDKFLTQRLIATIECRSVWACVRRYFPPHIVFKILYEWAVIYALEWNEFRCSFPSIMIAAYMSETGGTVGHNGRIRFSYCGTRMVASATDYLDPSYDDLPPLVSDSETTDEFNSDLD